jgi:hypothetical protein
LARGRLVLGFQREPSSNGAASVRRSLVVGVACGRELRWDFDSRIDGQDDDRHDGQLDPVVVAL